MTKIGIGIVGAGFAAGFHAEMYRHLASLDVELVAVVSRTREKAEDLAKRYGIGHALSDYVDLLARPDIDIVDLCVPNHLHSDFAVQAAQAGKHIVCEKPLTGYFGQGEEHVGATARSKMLEVAVASADAMVAAAKENSVKLMYGENWVYAPALQKVQRLVEASGGTILDIRGEESHHGSASPYSLHWRYTGGGALMRLGSHPIGGMLHLKRQEGIWRDGKPITPLSVMAQVADLTQIASFAEQPTEWIVRGWEDVENWASAIITFSDGSKGIVTSTDTCLGGLRDHLEIYMSNARIQCNMSRNNLIETYAPDPSVFESEYLAEKLETKAGWNFPSVNEEWSLGYEQELRDFCEAVQFDREPLSDGELGRDVVKVIYCAYLSAERNQAVPMS